MLDKMVIKNHGIVPIEVHRDTNFYRHTAHKWRVQVCLRYTIVEIQTGDGIRAWCKKELNI